MISASQVELKHVEQVLSLYKQICGGHPETVNPKDVLARFESGGDHRSNQVECQIGSRWTLNSKLYFRNAQGRFTAYMLPNFNDRTHPKFPEAKAAAEQFRAAVEAL